MNGFPRAWKFFFPYEESECEQCGITVSSSGGIQMVSGETAIRQSLLMLLSTSPGERVMKPDYGCDLRHLAFSENDETTAGLAIHYIRQAVERWEPRIRILRLDARANLHYEHVLDISIEYRTVPTGRTKTVELSVDLIKRGPDVTS